MGRAQVSKEAEMQQTLLTLTNLALAAAASLDLKQVAVPRLRAASGDGNENEAFQQRLQCWDRTSQNGDSVIATDYMPYISDHNMDNRIESCVFNGIWVLYGDEVYNGGNPLAHNFWAFGENYPTDMPTNFKNEASSLRYVGHPSDMYKDSTMGSLHSLANDISSVAVGCYAKDKFYPDSMNVTSRSANGATGFFGVH